MLAMLGLLLGWIALATPPADPVWRFFLLAIAGGALWLAHAVWRATTHRVELTEEGLFDETGRRLAGLDEIAGVERGAFAFKPSGGFMVRLRQPGRRAWAPGLWWRIGRRLGIGGVTAAHQSRHMAEVLAMMLAERRD